MLQIFIFEVFHLFHCFYLLPICILTNCSSPFYEQNKRLSCCVVCNCLSLLYTFVQPSHSIWVFSFLEITLPIYVYSFEIDLPLQCIDTIICRISCCLCTPLFLYLSQSFNWSNSVLIWRPHVIAKSVQCCRNLTYFSPPLRIVLCTIICLYPSTIEKGYTYWICM